eukprot:scaffold14896_cov18-Tisochrysis_lutea.AAC.3
MSSDAKQAAEARRAKILARSKARINSVGGGGGLGDEEPRPQATAATPREPSSSQQEPSPIMLPAQQPIAQTQPRGVDKTSAETPTAAPPHGIHAPAQEYIALTQPATASSTQP